MTQCTWKTPPSKEPIEIPNRLGMLISTGGVLLRAADLAGRHRHSAEFGLRQLCEHIAELRASPTAETLGEFLSLWVE